MTEEKKERKKRRSEKELFENGQRIGYEAAIQQIADYSQLLLNQLKRKP